MIDYEVPPRRTSKVLIRLIEVILVLGVVGGWYVWKRSNVTPEDLVQDMKPPPRPTARSLPPRPSTGELDRVRHALSDEVDRLLADRQRPRWTALPESIRDVWIDASGKAWFEVPIADSAALQRPAAIREAIAGKTRVLYGLPLLVDRRGRIWNYESRVLRRYEGEAFTDFPIEPVAAASAPASQPAGPSRQGRGTPDRVSLKQVALEDSAGNCWFVAGGMPGTWQIIRISPEGTLDRFPIGGDMRSGALADSLDFRFVEQPRGVITLVAPIGPPRPESGNLSTGRLLIFRWNGSTWAQIQPAACEHAVNYVLPQRDGSIKYFCHGGRLWTWWPPELLETAKTLAMKHVADLDSLEAERRDRAMRSLLTIGPQLVPFLPQPNNAGLSAEAQLRLEIIHANYTAAAELDERRVHSSVAAYDVGIEFGTASPVARTHDEGIVIYAANVRRPALRQTDPKAMIWVDPDGRCTVQPLPENWSDVDADSSTRSSFADASGRLFSAGLFLRYGRPYVECNVLMPNNLYARAIPPGIEIHRIIGQDSERRIYFHATGRVLVLDSTLAWPDWRWQPHWGEGIRSLPGAVQGWTHIPYDDRPPDLRLLLGPGDPEEISLPEGFPQAVNLLPLKNGAVICEGSGAGPHVAMFFDGQAMHRADTIQQLVREHAAAIQPLAPQTFDPTEYDSSVAASDRGGLWLVVRPPRGVRITAARLATRAKEIHYFDGMSWRDVLADIQKVDPTFNGDALCAAERGRAIVLSDSHNRRILWVSYESGEVKVKITPIDQVLRGLNNFRSIPDPTGGVWLGTLPTNGSTYFIRGDVQGETRPRTSPLLTDSRGRTWFADFGRGMLLCKAGEKWHELPVKALNRESRVVEGPDRRVWLLQNDSIGLVELTSGAASQIREVGRWQWDGPKTSFAGAFVDAGNGLWLDGTSMQVVRYVLPAGGGAP